MRNMLLCFYFFTLLQLLSPSVVRADDWHHFEKIARHTINAIEKRNLSNIDQLISMQEQLVELGVQGCAQYANINPEDAKMLKLVMDNAENMKLLSLSEIQQQWHTKRYMLKQGISVEKLRKNSPTGRLMDSIIHPATAFIALKEYRRTGDENLLKQVNLELTEAIFQITYMK